MPEKPKQFENVEFEKTPRPNLLDVVKIDGRWAQAIVDGNIIRYLDDGSDEPINWDNFKMTKNWKGASVCTVRRITKIDIEEIKRIHWGKPEDERRPELKMLVSVFGEYEKKPRKE